MNDFYNHIQYVVPENTEICFSILPEVRDVSLKLLDGVADIYVENELIQRPLQQEIPLQLWECSRPRLKTETGCNFLVRGSHYVFSAIQHGSVEKTLFTVSPSEDSYSFVLGKDIQLQIFPVISTDQESSVTISSRHGAPEVSGFELSNNEIYHLSPFSPILLKSSDKEPYSVYVNGLYRKIKLSILDENHHNHVAMVKYEIFYAPKSFAQFKNPTILVLGPKNVGKTSFCQLLVKEALLSKIAPIYVDMNIKRNLSVPGSLSLSEVIVPIRSTPEFDYNIKKLLHYGSVDFHPVNQRFYEYLVQRMGILLKPRLEEYNENKKRYLSVIDTDGSQGENITAIEFFLKSFACDIVVYIGDIRYYRNLKNSVLRTKKSAFIPSVCNPEQPSEPYEARYYQHRIQKYFFGSTTRHSAGDIRIAYVAFHDFAIYRISASPYVTITRDEEISQNTVESIDINPSMVNHLFAVSASERVEFPLITEVKYYVYFTNINMNAKMACVMVPEYQNFVGGILLMGSVMKPEDSEII